MSDMPRQQQAASKVWDIKLPPMWRQDFIDKGTTDPQQLDPALKGISALEFPITLVVVSKGKGVRCISAGESDKGRRCYAPRLHDV